MESPEGHRYADNGRLCEEEGERACTFCHLLPTSDGYDHCIGFIKGAVSVCCGHAVEPGWIAWELPREHSADALLVASAGSDADKRARRERKDAAQEPGTQPRFYVRRITPEDDPEQSLPGHFIPYDDAYYARRAARVERDEQLEWRGYTDPEWTPEEAEAARLANEAQAAEHAAEAAARRIANRVPPERYRLPPDTDAVQDQP